MILLSLCKTTPRAQGDHARFVVQLWSSMLTCVLVYAPSQGMHALTRRTIRAKVSFTSHATSWITLCVHLTTRRAMVPAAAGVFWGFAETG